MELLVVFLGCLVASAAATCNCEKKHIQEYFCASDFVANVTINSKTQLPQQGKFSYIVYDVTLNKMYKSTPQAILGLEKGELESGATAASCGVTWLKPGDSLIVSGYFDVKTNRPQFSICGMLLFDLTANQETMFNGGYQTGCDKCQITTCARDCSKNPTQPEVCPWNTNWSFEDCQVRYSACVPMGPTSTGCHWKSSSEYTACLSPDQDPAPLSPAA